MPHPIPIIIGTTIAVAATGYALKKFVYDPHLAPVIEAFIEQQRQLHRRRRPVAVATDRNEGWVEGRTTAVAGGGLRKRNTGELYELDETMAQVDAPMSMSSSPRRRKPVPPLDESSKVSPNESSKAGPVPAAQAVPLIAIEKDLPSLPPPLPSKENPFADSGSSDRSLPPTVSPMPSSAPSLSPTVSHMTLIDAPSSPNLSGMDELDIVSVSGNSYIDAESYTPRTFSPHPGSSRASPMLESALSFSYPSPVNPMMTSDLTFPGPNASHHVLAPASGRPSPASDRASGRASPGDDVLSVSSWTEDEWRSEAESEWDVVSDAPSH
ncbi:hypothetical protein CspeluHIS016_0406760 [Cutaneotrichosporon spelunceum]|uniref:Uncharacterized protein n=1 Tax=Cutaneotrichosporon spelunceum TaxID=1672016 RepID=A0AAD3TVU0_9TREE|nr:hypothetical protein CspeluHIS016_0406760 [Cutaneotrichosporon spelunceum]